MMNLFPKTHIDFLKYRKVYFSLFAAVLVAGVISFATKGMNWGIDFTGGTMVQVQFDKPVDMGQLRDALSATGANSEIQSYGDNAFSISEKSTAQEVGVVQARIEKALDTLGVPYTVQQTNSVGPAVGANMAERAGWAIVLSLFFIIIYVAFRFNDIFLTVAGFSINDTIVIFDRMRENMHLHPKMSFAELINTSINETLSRTVITTVTVLFALFVLYFLGGEVINSFALAMLVGCISGVYSTIALTTPLVYTWHHGQRSDANTQAAHTHEQPRKETNGKEMLTPKRRHHGKRK